MIQLHENQLMLDDASDLELMIDALEAIDTPTAEKAMIWIEGEAESLPAFVQVPDKFVVIIRHAVRYAKCFESL